MKNLSEMRLICLLLLGSLLSISGCASMVTGYERGDLIKEKMTGKTEYVDEKTELSRVSNMSVKVEKVERYGDVVINHYEQKELITKRRPTLNPFSLVVYTVYRAIIGPLYLVGGLFGNGKLLWHGFEYVVLPIPDCSKYGPYANQSDDAAKLVCVESNFTRVVNSEYRTEKKYVNFTSKRVPVTNGSVSISIAAAEGAGIRGNSLAYAASQDEKKVDPRMPVKKKKAKKAKKAESSNKTADSARQNPSAEASQSDNHSVQKSIYQEEIPIQSDGTASVDLAKLYDKIPRVGHFTIAFRYQGQTVESQFSHADVARAIAARKPPQLEITRKIETEGGVRNGSLSGDDSGTILVTVTNRDSQGTAWGVNLSVTGNNCPGVTYETLIPVGELRPGEKRAVRVPVTAGLEAKACKLALTVQAREEFGQDSRKISLPPLAIKPLALPELHVAKVSQHGIAQNDTRVELDLAVMNKGVGEARGVMVTLAGLPSGVIANQNPIKVGDMPSNSVQNVTTTLHFAKRFGEKVRSVPVDIKVTDQRPIGRGTIKHHTIEYRYNKPMIKIADVEFFDGNDQGGLSQGNGNNLIDQGEWILVKASVMNSGSMVAENVKVMFSSDKPISRLPIDPPEPVIIASLKPGEVKTVDFKAKVSHSLEGFVEFKTIVGEELFESLVVENRKKQIHAAVAEEGAIDPAQVRATAVRAPRSVVQAGVNIDEVEATDFRRNDAYALLIGIGRYKQVSDQLPYAAADAKVMRDYLAHVGGVPRDNIMMLTDEDATYTGIKSKLTWLAKTAGESATVFIYFSGHGTADVKAAGKPYLLPFDGDPGTLEDTAISLSELKQKINGFRTKNVLVALEACYAGGGHSVGAKGAHPVALVADDNVQTEAVIISASRANEASWDHPEQKHGIFTYALLNGMRGAAARTDSEFITVNDLFDYLRKEVPLVANKTQRVQQNPTKGGGDGRSIIVSRRAR